MFIGIDLGTSSVKIILIDSRQKIIASHSEPIELINIKDGYYEQDPEIWYKKKYNYGARIKKKSKKFKKKSGKESASNFFAQNNELKKLKERLKFE